MAELVMTGASRASMEAFGASDARIVVILLHTIESRGLSRGMVAICSGGGEGTAIAIERQ